MKPKVRKSIGFVAILGVSGVLVGGAVEPGKSGDSIFVPTVTLGNVVTVIGFVVSVAAYWQKDRDKLESLTKQMEEHTDQIKAISEKLEDIAIAKTDIHWIKERLDTMSRCK